MKIAIFGYGVVGSGVACILEKNPDVVSVKAGEEITVKYVLDIREFPGDPIQEKIVHDINVILDDPEIETVVETMGGEEPAYTFVKAALLAGKNAVTSNKVLVAAHGAELIALAAEKNVNFFFEASVGGGIPIIRPLCECITADRVQEIRGILNGTTNYMLTGMKRYGSSYDEVLRQAQENGYAEKDPTADVEGFDACRKIAILTSIACGQQVDYEDIPTEGITKLSAVDFAYARALDGDIKLIGSSRIGADGVFAKVSPEIIGSDDPMYSVNDVFNSIKVTGDMLGDVMFYGRGAGSLPTASAVIADVVQTVKNRGRNLPLSWKGEKLVLKDISGYTSRFLIRLQGVPEEGRLAALKELFGEITPVCPEGVEGEFAVLTGVLTKAQADAACEKTEGFIAKIYVR